MRIYRYMVAEVTIMHSPDMVFVFNRETIHTVFIDGYKNKTFSYKNDNGIGNQI